MKRFFGIVCSAVVAQLLMTSPLFADAHLGAPGSAMQLGKLATLAIPKTPAGKPFESTRTLRSLAQVARAGVDLQKIKPRITTEDPLAKYPRVIRPDERQARRCMMLMQNLWQLDRALDVIRDGKIEAPLTRSVDIGGQEVDLQKVIKHSRNLSRVLNVGDDMDWDGLEKAFAEDAVPTRHSIPYLKIDTFSANLQKIINALPGIDTAVGAITAPTFPPPYTLITDTQMVAGTYTISTPGVYRLADSVLMTSGTGPAITITADHVVVDLAGQTIDGGAQDIDGIKVEGDYCLIKNGTVKNVAPSTGAFFPRAAILQDLAKKELRLQDLNLVDNNAGSNFCLGTYLYGFSSVQRCFCANNRDSGLRLDGANGVVRDTIGMNSIESGSEGLGVTGAALTVNNVMKNCVAAANLGNGISVTTSGGSDPNTILGQGCVSLNNGAEGFGSSGGGSVNWGVLGNCYARGNGTFDYQGGTPKSFTQNTSITPASAKFWDCIGVLQP